MTEEKEFPKDNKEYLKMMVNEKYDPLETVLFAAVAKANDQEGSVRILLHKETKRIRVLMRTRDCLKVIYNHFACPGIELDVDGSKVQYEVDDCATQPHKVITVNIDFGDDQKNELNDFVSKFKEGQEANQKLLESSKVNNGKQTATYKSYGF